MDRCRVLAARGGRKAESLHCRLSTVQRAASVRRRSARSVEESGLREQLLHGRAGATVHVDDAPGGVE